MITIPHLETDVTQACQLSCVACNHSVPLYRAKGPKHADVDQIEKDLNHLSSFLTAEAWGALGGEPLLNKRLVDILHVARQSRVAKIIEVWTNGILALEQKDEFWRSFDKLVVSAYPGYATDEHLELLRRKTLDFGVELRVIDERNQPNFRTLFEKEPTNEERTAWKFKGCFFRHFSRVANNGYFFTCCCAPHLPMLMQGREFGSDGVLIETLDEQSLNAYLDRSNPLGACTICAGRDTAVAIPWTQQRDAGLWINQSGRSM